MNKSAKEISCFCCLREEVCFLKNEKHKIYDPENNICDFKEASKRQMIERLKKAKLLHYKEETIKEIEDYLYKKYKYVQPETNKRKLKFSVTGWISFFDTEKENCPYKEIPNKYFNEAFSAIVEDIKKWNYNFTGQEHQNEDYCVPVINNKYFVTCSCRMWGEIMARAHDHYEDLDYVLWAWNTTCEGIENFVYPDPDNYISNKGVK